MESVQTGSQEIKKPFPTLIGIQDTNNGNMERIENSATVLERCDSPEGN